MIGNNVIKLQNENVKVYDQIQKYLTNHSYNSERTRISYETDIKQFFKIVRDKDINELNIDDIQVTLDDFEDFINVLYNERTKNGERKYSNKTINRKVSAVKGLVKYLGAKKLIQDTTYFNLIRSLPEVSNSYGVLSIEEVFQMADLALQEREKGEVKRLAILLAFDICIRQNALLNLKWSDFIERENDVLVKGVDKGNKEFRETISKEFYQELLKIKEPNSEYVFNISKKALNESFNRIKKKMNIDPERNITWHSLKKAGVSFRYRLTGNDILEAQRAAKHSRLDTTRLYLQETEYNVPLGGVSNGGKIDTELYKKVDHETLVKAIDDLNKDIKLILNIKLSKIISGQ